MVFGLRLKQILGLIQADVARRHSNVSASVSSSATGGPPPSLVVATILYFASRPILGIAIAPDTEAQPIKRIVEQLVDETTNNPGEETLAGAIGNQACGFKTIKETNVSPNSQANDLRHGFFNVC